MASMTASVGEPWSGLNMGESQNSWVSIVPGPCVAIGIGTHSYQVLSRVSECKVYSATLPTISTSCQRTKNVSAVLVELYQVL